MLGLGSTTATTLKNLNLIVFYNPTNQEKTLVEILTVNLKLIGNVKFPAQ